VPPEEQINPEDPFWNLPMETSREANKRRRNLLPRPYEAIEEIVWISPMHGLGVFAGPNGYPARSILECTHGQLWYTAFQIVFRHREFNIPLRNLTWYTDHRIDSIERGEHGEVRVPANLINANLQFGQIFDSHPNFLFPTGLSDKDIIPFHSRPNCIVAVYRDRVRGTVHVIAETTRDIPGYGEWLTDYPVETHTDVHASRWLVEDSVDNWIDSTPHVRTQYLVRCVEERSFDMQDIAVLAFDFFRFDYRSACSEQIHQSVWVYYFPGEYLRTVSTGQYRSGQVSTVQYRTG
jgi:hypothetical protein